VIQVADLGWSFPFEAVFVQRKIFMLLDHETGGEREKDFA